MSSEATLRLPKGLLEPAHTPEDECQISGSAVASSSIQELDGFSDENLLTAVAKGSKDALTILFRRHGRAVWTIAWKVLRDDAEAADLRQDVFLHLFERAKLYDPKKGSAISWILQITYHCAIDRRRFLSCRHHYRMEELDGGQFPAIGLPSEIDKIDGRAILDDLQRHLSE
ncbi:MAG: hypothetical protein JF563_05580, partial [Acidobacteriales bacterium]|nr:hypothetical protein [Terriglobales bacterium]